MYTRFIKFLGQLLSRLDCAIIGVVDDDLPALLEEIPNERLASKPYLAPKRFSFRTFFAFTKVSRSSAGQAKSIRTESEIVFRQIVCSSKNLPSVVSKTDDLCLDAHPSQVSLQCTGDVRLTASGEPNGYNDDLASVKQQPRGLVVGIRVREIS